jgi:hypothetical protein
MLIAVDGPSAVGKTTLLRSLPTEQVVGEDWEPLGVSRADRPADPLGEEMYRFQVDISERRWAKLLDVEARHGVAFADTDPLKLYYDFATVAVGAKPRIAFERDAHATRLAVAAGRLGFVDHVLLLSASPETLAARRARDLEETGRRRGNFSLHQRLGPAMEAYYAALEGLRPGTVHLLDAGANARPRALALLARLAPHGYERHALQILDSLVARLEAILP